MRNYRAIFSLILALLLAAFLVLGSSGNAFPSEEIAASYRKWGYPSGFNYLTATLEFVSAILLLLPRTRAYGAALASLVMTGALATRLYHGEYAYAIAPIVVLAVAITVFLLSRKRTATQINARRNV